MEVKFVTQMKDRFCVWDLHPRDVFSIDRGENPELYMVIENKDGRHIDNGLVHAVSMKSGKLYDIKGSIHATLYRDVRLQVFMEI